MLSVKRKLIIACILLWALHLSAGTTTLTGIIRDEQGNPLNGTLVLRLPIPAQDPNTNTAIAPTPVTFQLINGQVTGGAPLFDLATIQPNKLWYAARGYDTAGRLAYYGNFYVTGATFNIGTATPVTVTTSNIVFANPFITNANNTVTGNNTFSGTNTFTGSNTFSSTNTFSGNNTLSGNNTFSGTNAFTKSIVAAALNGIVYVDGTTYTTLSAALNALPAGGGTVVLQCGQTYSLTNTFVPTNGWSGVALITDCPFIPPAVADAGFGGSGSISTNNATIQVSGGDFTIGGAGSTHVNGLVVRGIVWDMQGAGGMILENVSYSKFDMSIIHVISTSACLYLFSPSAAVGSSSINQFPFLYCQGGYEGVRFAGLNSGPNVSTENIFGEAILVGNQLGVGGATASYTGVDFSAWSDTNTFYHVLFQAQTNGPIVGVKYNSTTPGSSEGVYNDNIYRFDVNYDNLLSGSPNNNAGTFLYVAGITGQDTLVLGAPGNGNFLVNSTNNNPNISLNGACSGTNSCEVLLQSTFNGTYNRGTFDPALRITRLGTATTGSTQYSTGSITWTFSVPFLDTNYTVICTESNPSGFSIGPYYTSKAVGSVVINIANAAGGGAVSSSFDCMAKHDVAGQY